MKKGFLFAAVLLLAVSFTNSASAQTVKIGYFDDQVVLSIFPGIQKVDTLLQSYVRDTLQDEYNYTVKQLQLQDSIYRRDSAELSKRPKALELATAELTKLKIKYFNWQQYQQQAEQAKTEELLNPFRQKILVALNEVISENKYTVVLNQSSLSPYLNPLEPPYIADNLSIRVAMKLKLPLPKNIEENFRIATGGAPAKSAAPAKAATPAKKP
jgi:Skp family chaperone for outer membrane proteins